MDREIPMCCIGDNLSEAARRDLADHATWREYAAGDRILGFDASPQLLLLCSGYVKLSAVSPAGYRRAPLVLRTGDAVDVHLFHRRTMSDFDVTALTSCRIASIPEPALHVVARRHPEIWSLLADRFAEQVEELIERWVSVSSEEVAVRLSRVLLDIAPDGESEELVDLEIPITHTTLAELVAASRPHVSSVIAGLEASGAVRRGSSRSSFQVRPAALRELVRNGAPSRA